MSPQNGRAAAVEAVRRLNGEQAYSNILVHTLLDETTLPPREKSLATALIYGTVERRLTIDYLLSKCSSKPLDKLHPTILAILQTAVYQLLYMDKIPPSAAVNEAVKLARTYKLHSAAGFVNAVLRSVLRRQMALFAELDDSDEGLSLRHSCPVEWIRFWRTHYGDAHTNAMLPCLNGTPPAYVRVNTHKTTAEKLLSHLQQYDVQAVVTSDLANCLQLYTDFQGNTLEKEKKNWYYYQDKASQYACAALEITPGQRVADVCAAPGGKSLTVSQYLQGKGEVIASDIYPAKCATIRCRAEEMGANTIRVVQRDAATSCPSEWQGYFDRVLCDVPCSGLGVIRRKPEIRYKSLSDFAQLPALQYRILCESAAMVTKGGYLQYSTCTLNPLENERVAERFLQEHPDFAPRILPLSSCFTALGISPSWHITLFPHIHDCDGFFIAGFVRKG